MQVFPTKFVGVQTLFIFNDFPTLCPKLLEAPAVFFLEKMFFCLILQILLPISFSCMCIAQLCGVITRLNLTHDFLHKCHHRRQQMEL